MARRASTRHRSHAPHDDTAGPISRAEFAALVEEALTRLPRAFKRRMENIAVVIEEEPSRFLLRDMGIPRGETLFGLYQGVPTTARGGTYGNVLPDKVSIYRGPILAWCRTRDEVRDLVRDVVIHEVGHYFGLSDQEMEGE